jgi:hypothetical protein
VLKTDTITYKRKTYAPVKDIAEACGKVVTIDQKGNIIHVKDKSQASTNTSSYEKNMKSIVKFMDINFEKHIRKQINKPNEDIYQSDLKNITGIFSQGDNITSLDGVRRKGE